MTKGYRFMLSITQAIEAWSDDIARYTPGAFLHRGMDLRHAVERDLFFRLANDIQLQKRFYARLDGEQPSVDLTDPWSMVFDPYVAATTGAPPLSRHQLPYLSPKRRLRTWAGNLRRLGKRPFATNRQGVAPRILFLCIHPKFARFFATVLDAAGHAGYLTIADRPLEAALDAQGVTVIALRPVRFSPLHSPVLQHFPHLCSLAESLGRMMTILCPTAIAVPEGNAPIYELALLAANAHSVPTICIQHGAPAYTNPGFRNWHFDDVLVWGDAFIEPFARYNPGQHFTVAGTPAVLPAAADRGSESVRSIGFFLQKGATVIPETEWEPLLDLIVWTAQTFPQLEVIVRDHPSQPHLSAAERGRLDGLSNIRFMPPPAHSLNDALAASDVVVAAASTTLLEAVQAGAIPFIFGTAYPADFPDIAAAGAGVRAPDLAEAQGVMTRLISDQGWQAALRQEGNILRPHLFAASGRDGAARIAACLQQPRKAAHGYSDTR
jgi:hypothetical protein